MLFSWSHSGGSVRVVQIYLHCRCVDIYLIALPSLSPSTEALPSLMSKILSIISIQHSPQYQSDYTSEWHIHASQDLGLPIPSRPSPIAEMLRQHPPAHLVPEASRSTLRLRLPIILLSRSCKPSGLSCDVQIQRSNGYLADALH